MIGGVNHRGSPYFCCFRLVDRALLFGAIAHYIISIRTKIVVVSIIILIVVVVVFVRYL